MRYCSGRVVAGTRTRIDRLAGGEQQILVRFGIEIASVASSTFNFGVSRRAIAPVSSHLTGAIAHRLTESGPKTNSGRSTRSGAWPTTSMVEKWIYVHQMSAGLISAFGAVSPS